MHGLFEDSRVYFAIEALKEHSASRQYSDVVDAEGRQYVDLVLGGGGVLGIALAGYAYALEQAGLRFLRLGGTSVGSVAALLLSALGPPSEARAAKFASTLAQLDLASLIDGSPRVASLLAKARAKKRSTLGLAADLVRVWRPFRAHLGLNPGQAFYAWVRGVLEEAGITTTRQLLDRCSFPPGLFTRQGTPYVLPTGASMLALVAADISTQTKVIFPQMAALYWEDPMEVNPADYVRASMSVPFFFRPYRVTGLPTGEQAWSAWSKHVRYDGIVPETCTFVDGGIMSNFPIDVFHDPRQVPSLPTFGAKLGSRARNPNRIDNAWQLASAVFESARHTLDYEFITRNPDYSQLVGHIDTGPHYWLDFALSPDAKADLFLRGILAASEFLQRFRWDEYKRVRAGLALPGAAAGQ